MKELQPVMIAESCGDQKKTCSISANGLHIRHFWAGSGFRLRELGHCWSILTYWNSPVLMISESDFIQKYFRKFRQEAVLDFGQGALLDFPQPAVQDFHQPATLEEKKLRQMKIKVKSPLPGKNSESKLNCGLEATIRQVRVIRAAAIGRQLYRSALELR